jgi:hypothetical protein
VDKGFSIFSWRFFTAGRGLSFRTGKYFGESMLVGVLTGLVVVGFRYMIDFGKQFIMEGIGHHSFVSSLSDKVGFFSGISLEALTNPYRWLLVFLPAVGAVLGYLLIKRFSSVEHARGKYSASAAALNNQSFHTSSLNFAILR